MLYYIGKRLLSMLPLLFGITLICFAVIQLSPGDPVTLGTSLNQEADADAHQKLREAYGLNKPLHEQYLTWLKGLIQLDFGTSFAPDNRPVIDKITESLPVTLWMNIIGLFFVFLIAIPLGVMSAKYQDSFFDKTSTVILFIAFAAPSFWVALMGMIYFGLHLEWLPISGISTYGSESWPLHERILDWAKHLVLPIGIGVLGSIAGMSRYMRSSMLEVIRQDYITTAKSKGLTNTKVFYKHGLLNALLPVITILGLSIPGLIGGSVIFESMFSIPGMGRLFFDAVMMRDYPVIMGILTIGALLTLIGNLLADVAYSFADPRIRFGGQKNA